MTSIAGTLAVVVVVLAAASVALLWLLMRRTRAVRALRNSEDKFRVIAEGAPVMIWSARPDTPRQRDILRLIVKGQRMKEIAATLGLSTRTVEGYKYEMMEALGVTSTAELVRYALDRRLYVE